MNQFEFLRSVPVGQYLPTGSWVHRLDPRAKLVIYTALVLALSLSVRLSGVLAGFLFLLIALRISHVPYRFALKSLLTPLPLIFFLMGLQILLSPAPPGAQVYFRVWLVDVNSADVYASFLLLARFMTLVLALGLMSYTLSTSEMIAGLNNLLAPLARFGLPVQDLAMVVQVTLRFIPLLAQAAERVAKAQVSRGADWQARRGNPLASVRQMMPLLVPLFLSSMRRAENMALAMDARSYGSSLVRSSMAQFDLKWTDAAAMGLAAASVVLIVLL